MIPFPDTLEFPHVCTPDGRGRSYWVDGHTKLLAFHVEEPLSYAPDGFFVYVFVQGETFGDWQWTTDPQAMVRVMQTYRFTTSPAYVPEVHLGPDGEIAQLRPPLQELLARAIEEARPDAARRALTTSVSDAVISLEARRGLTLEPPDS